MSYSDSVIQAESGGDLPADAMVWKIFGLPDVFAKFWVVGIFKLLFGGCPSAIAGLVVTGTVNSVYRVFFARLRSHVSEEVVKTSPPSLAHLNAATSVPRVADLRRVETSLDDGAPRSVFWSSPSASTNGDGHSVRFVDDLYALIIKASAALCIARLKVWHSHRFFIPAITFAQEAADTRARAIFALLGRSLRNGGKLPEFHANIILAGAHA